MGKKEGALVFLQVGVETKKSCKSAKSPLMVCIYVHVWRAKTKGVVRALHYTLSCHLWQSPRC